MFSMNPFPLAKLSIVNFGDITLAISYFTFTSCAELLNELTDCGGRYKSPWGIELPPVSSALYSQIKISPSKIATFFLHVLL